MPPSMVNLINHKPGMTMRECMEAEEEGPNWPDGFIEAILDLLDLIEMEDDASLARQRHRIAEDHGLTVEIGEQVSGMIN